MHAAHVHLEEVGEEVGGEGWGVKQELRRMSMLSQSARVNPAADQPGGVVKSVVDCMQEVNKGSAYAADPGL